MSRASNSTTIAARDYDLAATLNSGQAFRWNLTDGGWEAVIARKWVFADRRKFGSSLGLSAEEMECHGAK